MQNKYPGSANHGLLNKYKLLIYNGIHLVIFV